MNNFFFFCFSESGDMYYEWCSNSWIFEGLELVLEYGWDKGKVFEGN